MSEFYARAIAQQLPDETHIEATPHPTLLKIADVINDADGASSERTSDGQILAIARILADVDASMLGDLIRMDLDMPLNPHPDDGAHD